MLGYYLFLGRGDWGTSREQTLDPTFDGNVDTHLLGDWGPHRRGTPLTQAPEWTSAWGLEVWKQRVNFLRDVLKADSLLLLMNGFELPYPSARFPEAVERDHANVNHEFLQDLLNYARGRGLEVGAQFCTTGHAVAMAMEHPDLATIGPDNQRHPTNLCHHHPGGRTYAEGVTREVLARYHGFSSVSFHPPENAVPCHCHYCRRAFEQEKGRAFITASEQERSNFYWASCLRFQRSMENLASEMVPGVRIMSITIPGRFETDFAVIAPEIPLSTLILHWDYWSYGERIPDVLRSLATFRSRGHRVGFIPTSGWSLDKCGPDYGRQVCEQIAAVRSSGVTDLVYFVGGIWHEPSLRATSWALHDNR